MIIFWCLQANSTRYRRPPRPQQTAAQPPETMTTVQNGVEPRSPGYRSQCRVENAYSDIWNKRVTVNIEVTEDGMRTTLMPSSDTLTTRDSLDVRRDSSQFEPLKFFDPAYEMGRDADCGEPPSEDELCLRRGLDAPDSDGDYMEMKPNASDGHLDDVGREWMPMEEDDIESSVDSAIDTSDVVPSSVVVQNV